MGKKHFISITFRDLLILHFPLFSSIMLISVTGTSTGLGRGRRKSGSTVEERRSTSPGDVRASPNSPSEAKASFSSPGEDTASNSEARGSVISPEEALASTSSSIQPLRPSSAQGKFFFIHK